VGISIARRRASISEAQMTDKRTQQDAGHGNMEKRPEDWTTGDEPMTGAQRSYLKTLSEEAKVPFDDSLTKAEASRRIDELQSRTGRGNAAGTPAQRPADARINESGQAESDAHGGDFRGVKDR
jgi:hypothetical protein